ncbi:MAG TPA: 50S ribosomal protein L7/L12 [Gemmataceae bacterium]|jgi:large subunit ribosomal protein L7/L12
MAAHVNGIPHDIKDLADRLSTLTLAQTAALRVYLEEVHGIRPSSVRQTMNERKEEAPLPEPTHFTVVLEGLADADKKIRVFKAVREVTGLGLKETRELIESAPATVKASVPKDEASVLRDKLEAAGARITLVPVLEG